jgi:hypothetical protein
MFVSSSSRRSICLLYQLAAGKELARSKAPSQLLVYKADGFEVQEEKTYE